MTDQWKSALADGDAQGAPAVWIRCDTVDSTNDEAKRRLRAGAGRGVTVVTARAQTAGRGTHDRGWVSPRDAGIYLTVAVPVAADVRVAPEVLTPRVGAVCAAVLREATGVAIAIRGVNDLYAAGCKLGGILTEMLFAGDAATGVIVGIGINVRRGAVALGEADATRPIALEDVTGAPWPAARVDDVAAKLGDAIVAVIAEAIADRAVAERPR
jgi:biotin-[acetyl-CoA-carboxylase] ligase BirA-like protein